MRRLPQKIPREEIAVAPGPDQSSIKVWDLPLRLFHWALPLLIFAAWASVEYAEVLHDATLKWHRLAVYALLVLCLWRVLWGFFGARSARFQSFVRGPGAVLSYGRDLVRGAPRHYLGHNPLGAWMVVALLGIMLLQSITGLLAAERDGVASGPLARFVTERLEGAVRIWHDGLFNRVLLPLIALHFAAALFYTFVKREPLIRAMVTGTKPVRAYEDEPDKQALAFPAGVRALACLAAAAALGLGPVYWFAGRL